MRGKLVEEKLARPENLEHSSWSPGGTRASDFRSTGSSSVTPVDRTREAASRVSMSRQVITSSSGAASSISACDPASVRPFGYQTGKPIDRGLYHSASIVRGVENQHEAGCGHYVLNFQLGRWSASIPRNFSPRRAVYISLVTSGSRQRLTFGPATSILISTPRKSGLVDCENVSRMHEVERGTSSEVTRGNGAECD